MSKINRRKKHRHQPKNFENQTTKSMQCTFLQVLVSRCPLFTPSRVSAREAEVWQVTSSDALQELDIIKLTAQFVALNGSSFLSGLKSREENKREFHFLKENHSLNLFFKRLTDAYSAVRLDSKEALVRLNEDATDANAVLQRCAVS